MFDVEKKCINWLKKYYVELGFVFITILAIFVRFSMLKFVTDDYRYYLSPWFDCIKMNGGLRALANYPGNYNAPYVTILAILTYIPLPKLALIKSVSIFFDFVLAISAVLLVNQLLKGNKKYYSLLVYSVVLFLPAVMLNGAMWGQCDSCYASFVILALLFLLKEKYIPSFIFLGCAFAFKLQFIFVLPIFIVLYICRGKFSLLHFLIIPTVNLILCLPAIIMGMPIIKAFSVYFGQTQYYKDRLVLNFPNIYNILKGPADIFCRVGVIFTIFLCASMLFYLIYKKVSWNDEKILNLTLWFVIIVTYFLPGMHERYLFVGEILAVIYYLVYKKNFLITIFIVLCSVVTYSIYLFYVSIPGFSYLSLIYLLLIVYFTRDTIRNLG